MCVGVPAVVISTGTGTTSRPARLRRIDGMEYEADLALIPHAMAGDYVITHSGFGVAVVGEARAFEVAALLSSRKEDLELAVPIDEPPIHAKEQKGKK